MARTLRGDRGPVKLAYTEETMASSVLVVDDDPNLVRLMSKFLKLEGFAPVPPRTARRRSRICAAAATRA